MLDFITLVQEPLGDPIDYFSMGFGGCLRPPVLRQAGTGISTSSSSSSTSSAPSSGQTSPGSDTSFPRGQRKLGGAKGASPHEQARAAKIVAGVQTQISNMPGKENGSQADGNSNAT